MPWSYITLSEQSVEISIDLKGQQWPHYSNEGVWLSVRRQAGKRTTSVRFPASALISLQKSLFMDTDCDFVPPQWKK